MFTALKGLDAGVFGTENGGEGGLIAGDEFDNGRFTVVRKLPGLRKNCGFALWDEFGERRGFATIAGGGEHGTFGVRHGACAFQGNDGDEAFVSLAGVDSTLLGI